MRWAVIDPALGGFHQHAAPELGAALQRTERGIGVGGVLLPAEHEEIEFRDQCMAELVRRHEQHVAEHELGARLQLLRRQVPAAWFVPEFARRFVDSRLDDLHRGRQVVRAQWRGAQPEQDEENTAMRANIEVPVSKRSASRWRWRRLAAAPIGAAEDLEPHVGIRILADDLAADDDLIVWTMRGISDADRLCFRRSRDEGELR